MNTYNETIKRNNEILHKIKAKSNEMAENGHTTSTKKNEPINTIQSLNEYKVMAIILKYKMMKPYLLMIQT